MAEQNSSIFFVLHSGQYGGHKTTHSLYPSIPFSFVLCIKEFQIQQMEDQLTSKPNEYGKKIHLKKKQVVDPVFHLWD
jgi:hypothetical protein